MPRVRRVPSPLEPCALALLQEGSWYGLVPTGYKFECGECRIAKGLHLGLLSIEQTSSSERQRTNEEKKKKISRKRTFATSKWPGRIVARRDVSPSTPRAFRRDP